jgi:TonB family protein
MNMLTLLALLAAPPSPLLPPPIVSVGSDFTTAVASFHSGPARCEEGEEGLLMNEPPFPQVSATASTMPPPDPVVLRFRIDSAGRPLGIAEEPRMRSGGGPYFNSRDVAAAFAASRFRAGTERRGCTIAYEVRVESVATADLATLYRLVALQPPPAFGARREIFERTTPPGSTCFNDPRLNVRLRAYPAFEEIPQTPGTLSYSFLAFDLDSGGRPQNVRLLGSDGNKELDRQSLDSVRRSRFSPIAKKGCSYSYWRRQSEPLAPPDVPEPDSYRLADASCPKEGAPWASMPPLSFPPEFERRGIEGWALLKFDVAPWGGVGNIGVLAAEPAAAFGQQAVQILTGARKPPSAQGYTGCVARLLFRMPASGPMGPVSDP